ncbi:PilW family protein [Halomonas rhizosphaerae]|uniref:Prepilin-type N-terminal cleavage/methylation domain-containing protein n=1 Tax=Halomonas rhizosphaerae TaxID=3043296 RepID=A0ABT6V0G1_9GAMM|nr:prepilin-type N-terminal cleavage/methylation domain-containing protein [Halomonas rhizosphaerae]MDI5890437.1 prepilin-type N-terminal cleavage/methylation domain-containing protein [Halomonas rhizosphaerae]
MMISHERLRVGGQKGFSLVELMVALVIGLLVVFGATQVFVAAKVSYNRTAELSVRQESLRFFVDILSLDVRSSAVNGVSVSADNATLSLEYDSRTDDPYCGAGNDLVSVNYSYSSGAVSLSYQCDSASYGPDPLVSGIEDVSFEQFVSIQDADLKTGYVKVAMSFPTLPGETSSDSTFTFRVANREAVAR